MSTSIFFFFFFLSLFTSVSQSASPYLSPTLFFPNYQKMLQLFKIYTYTPPQPFSFTSQLEFLFFSSLQTSPFLTQNPDLAHLFFIPFSSDLSSRSLAAFIRDIRSQFPYWNRSLGADHFYLSCSGLSHESDRNLVELKKNSVQISCFPSPNGNFIPHKDITLPPFNKTTTYRDFVKYNGVKDQFLIESEPSDEMTVRGRIGKSDFCLFEYGADISGIGGALSLGCVPVVITDRPIQDLPFMDVLRWQEIAVIVGSSGALGRVKGVLNRKCRGDTCKKMKRLGVEASRHFVWNEYPQPYDAFNTVMYQLWLRRHAIRYARREFDLTV